MKTTVMLLLLSTLSISLQAQQFNWPQDTAKAQTAWVLFSDAVKEKRFADALISFEWLLQEAPDLNVSLYIKGEHMYKGLMEGDITSGSAADYPHKLLHLYDQRMQYFGDEENVMNRKLLAAYRYLKPQESELQYLFDLFEKSFQEDADYFTQANLMAYMDVIHRIQVKANSLNDDDVLNRYEQISQLLAADDHEDVEAKQAILDKLLVSTISLNCDLIQDKFYQPFMVNQSEDFIKAKKLVALGLAYECKEADAFLKAAAIVCAQEPSFGLAKMLAFQHDVQGEYTEAEKYYQLAVDLSTDQASKTAMLLKLAEHYQRRAYKADARSAAYAALKIDPKLKEAFKLIGDLYLSSYEDCKKGNSAMEDRAVYIAAYQMYVQAGRSDMMEQMKLQFPTIEQIFQEGYQEGQRIKIECWINEEVVLQRRASLQ